MALKEGCNMINENISNISNISNIQKCKIYNKKNI